MTRFLFDTAVFLCARGREHEYRAPCREIVRLCEDGSLAGEASVELVQEYAHVLRRRGLDGATIRDESMAVGSLCLLHDFGAPELRLALGLVATAPGLGVRDAVHAATALRRGIGLIVSPDKAFDMVGGLERIDPRDAATRHSTPCASSAGLKRASQFGPIAEQQRWPRDFTPNMTTIAIMGAGRGLGAAVARRFGAEGFAVALISRNQGRVDSLADELVTEGIAARGFTADVRDPASISATLERVTEELGPIEVLQYSPLPQKGRSPRYTRCCRGCASWLRIGARSCSSTAGRP